MASPFRIFRKYQKTLLVVAGVVLMFVFVLGDSLRSLLSSRAGGGDPSRHPAAVAVSWEGGQLTNRELDMLVTKRRLVNVFLRTIEAEGRQAVYNSGAEVRPLRVALVGGADKPSEGVEQDVVQTAIFAEAAHKAGMRIDDVEVLQYLDEIGRGRVSRDQMRTILSSLQVQGRVATVTYMLDALRDELLARNFLLSYQFAWRTVLPDERWRDWLRVNDRVVVEAAAIPVNSFLIDVKDPTDEELTAFYDQYKEREQQPEVVLNVELPSSTPGFAIPRKVDVHYVLAEFDKYLDKVENEVTEEEIEKYYEDNKYPYFIRADVAAPSGAAAPGASDSQPAADGGASTDSTPPPAAGGTPAATTDKPASSTAGTTTTDSAPSPSDAAPAEQPAPATNDGSSDDRAQDSRFQLVAFQQEDKQGDDAAAGATTSESPTAGAAAADETTEQPVAAPAAGDAQKMDEKAVEYQPLEEVRDQIRRQLAEQKVSDQLRELLDGLEAQLKGAYSKYLGKLFDAEAAGKPVPPPPAELADLDALAAKNSLQAGKTGPVSFLELRDLPIGKSVTADDNNYPFAQYAFSQLLEIYEPVITFDIDNNRYLAFKSSDTPGRVPPLDEVRDEVVLAWKMQQAAKLALDHADEVAKKIQASGSWLSDYFAGDKNVQVVRTDPFSWLTVGNVSQRSGMVESFRMSQPDGIVAAGPDFMREVFELKGSNVGAVLNHDHTIAYVLRVVEHVESEDQLRQAFLSEANQWYGLPAMTQSHMQLAAQVLINDFLQNVYHVDWKRQADANIREE